MNRHELIETLFDRSGFGLEIGPSYNPIVTKSSGANIEILDHASQDDLRKKYVNEPAAVIDRIEPVDYVSDGRPMADVIGDRERYDYIIASHVIEHTPNMLGWLLDCQSLLKPSGRLVLVAPDKRTCFDVARPISSTGDVLQAYFEGRTRHSPGKLFDHLAYTGSRGSLAGWRPDDTSDFAFGNEISHARAWYERATAQNEYIDCHAWQFTPSSLRLMLHDLHAAGFLGLKEAVYRDPLGQEYPEFYIVLSRDAEGCPVSRLELADRIRAELAAIPSLISSDRSRPTMGSGHGP
jgi:hypothetical protein